LISVCLCCLFLRHNTRKHVRFPHYWVVNCMRYCNVSLVKVSQLPLPTTVVKGKAVPLCTPWRRLGERRYSSYSFSTSALDGGECSASRPGRAFTPGKGPPVAHWTGGWVGPRAGLDTEARGKILCPSRESNPDRPVVQPVVRHYTDWANPAP
jgi:hypothetical protein